MRSLTGNTVYDVLVLLGLWAGIMLLIFLPRRHRSKKALREGYRAAAKVYNPTGEEVYSLDITPTTSLPPGMLWEKGYRGYLEEHGLPVTDGDKSRIRHNPYMYRDESLRFEQE